MLRQTKRIRFRGPDERTKRVRMSNGLWTVLLCERLRDGRWRCSCKMGNKPYAVTARRYDMAIRAGRLMAENVLKAVEHAQSTKPISSTPL